MISFFHQIVFFIVLIQLKCFREISLKIITSLYNLDLYTPNEKKSSKQAVYNFLIFNRGVTIKVNVSVPSSITIDTTRLI